MRPRKDQPIPTLVLRDLQSGPATHFDLADSVGIHFRNMREYVKLMHDERLIHVSGWERRRQGPAVAVWSFGPGNDKDRPKGRRK